MLKTPSFHSFRFILLCVFGLVACGENQDPGNEISAVSAELRGGRPGGSKAGSECGGGVHLCTIVDAYKKCGVKKNKGERTWSADNPARNAMCCCHSDTCPEVCCEGAITSTGEIDAAMQIDSSGNVVILNQALYDRINADLTSCNDRGNLGGVDMVPKCARVDKATGDLRCPTGGATQDVPPEILCTGRDQCTGINPYCDSTISNSCGPNGECLCDEDPLP